MNGCLHEQAKNKALRTPDADGGTIHVRGAALRSCSQVDLGEDQPSSIIAPMGFGVNLTLCLSRPAAVEHGDPDKGDGDGKTEAEYDREGQGRPQF